MSYEFYLGKNNTKLYSILQFLYEQFPGLKNEDGYSYDDVLIIFCSHISKDIYECLQVARSSISKSSMLLVQLSLIYTDRIDSSASWFEILARFRQDSLIYQFLERTKIIAEMELRCLNDCNLVYRQISLKAVERVWYHNLPIVESDDELRKKWKGSVIINSKEEMILMRKK